MCTEHLSHFENIAKSRLVSSSGGRSNTGFVLKKNTYFECSDATCCLSSKLTRCDAKRYEMISKKPFQLTLAILKPHVVKSPFALEKIRDIIIDNDFKVVKSRRTIITREEAENFYADHKGKFFYNRLITFVCSGPSDMHILAGYDAIVRWRELMGPTKVYQAQYLAPTTIRGTFGLSDTRNAAHGSDSPESAEKEINIFFKDFNTTKWFQTEEPFFRLGQVRFDPKAFVHIINEVDTTKSTI